MSQHVKDYNTHRMLCEPLFNVITDPIERMRVVLEVRFPQQQRQFRTVVLERDEGRCVVSGCQLESALEAAHITPFSQDGGFDLSNGITLRADLHRLFDRHEWSINPHGHVVMSAGMALDGNYTAFKDNDVVFEYNEHMQRHHVSWASLHQG